MATQKTIEIIGALEDEAEQPIRLLHYQAYKLLFVYKESEMEIWGNEQKWNADRNIDIEYISCPAEAC